MSEPQEQINRRSIWAAVILIVLATFTAIAPTLSKLEFSGSMENLNVATVLEIRRTGHWLVPTLEGDARLNKPPLTAWVTTLFVPPALMQRLNEHDPALRKQAYEELAFRVRLAPLLETCLTILLVAGIAEIAVGGPATIYTAAAYGTSLLVLKLGRSATTDVQMTFWIALAELGVALVLWQGRRCFGCTIAGVGTGMALMSKGPVCLLFILLPVLVLKLMQRGSKQELTSGNLYSSSAVLPKRGTAPVLFALLLALAIGTPWYIFVYLKSPQVMHGWRTEVTRIGATENASRDPFFYLAIFPFLSPWLPWAIVGMVGGVIDLRRRRGTAIVWFTLSALLPLLVISCFPDRKDRYALPAMIPFAALAGLGAHHVLTFGTPRLRRALLAIQWITIAAAAIALPVAAAVVLKTADHQPWLAKSQAAFWLAVMSAVVIAGVLLQRRHRCAWLAATVAVMLIAQGVVMAGYHKSEAGLSDMKPLAEAIRSQIPDPGTVINTRTDAKRTSVDLAIYLNRSTTRVKNWQTLPLQNPPAVAILQQFGKSPDPAPPPGWRFIAKVHRNPDWLWAFVQDTP